MRRRRAVFFWCSTATDSLVVGSKQPAGIELCCSARNFLPRNWSCYYRKKRGYLGSWISRSDHCSNQSQQGCLGNQESVGNDQSWHPKKRNLVSCSAMPDEESACRFGRLQP